MAHTTYHSHCYLDAHHARVHCVTCRAHCPCTSRSRRPYRTYVERKRGLWSIHDITAIHSNGLATSLTNHVLNHREIRLAPMVVTIPTSTTTPMRNGHSRAYRETIPSRARGVRGWDWAATPMTVTMLWSNPALWMWPIGTFPTLNSLWVENLNGQHEDAPIYPWGEGSSNYGITVYAEEWGNSNGSNAYAEVGDVTHHKWFSTNSFQNGANWGSLTNLPTRSSNILAEAISPSSARRRLTASRCTRPRPSRAGIAWTIAGMTGSRRSAVVVGTISLQSLASSRTITTARTTTTRSVGPTTVDSREHNLLTTHEART